MQAGTTAALVIVIGLVTATSAGAAKPPAPAPQQDFVRGSATAGFFGQFDIDVRTGPSGGTSAVGQVSAQGAVSFSGPATCLAVTGNVAVVNAQTPQFGLVTFTITDNSASGTPDVVDGLPTQRAPSDCSPFGAGVVGSSPPAGSADGSVTSGDITVFDAPPAPTSKSQCKHGGWASFGFKNQGQCIAFVQHSA